MSVGESGSEVKSISFAPRLKDFVKADITCSSPSSLYLRRLTCFFPNLPLLQALFSVLSFHYSAKQILNILHHGCWLNLMFEEFLHVSLGIEQVLGKVPLGLALLLILGLQILIQRAYVFANNVLLGKDGELDVVLLSKPFLDLRLGPGLLRSK